MMPTGNRFSWSSTVLLCCYLALYFLIAIYLNYHQVYNEMFYELAGSKGAVGFESDTPEHVVLVSEYFAGIHYLPHPLWHYGVKTTSELFSMTYDNAAILLSSYLLVFWAYLVYSVVKVMTKNVLPSRLLVKDGLLLMLTTVILTIAPLTLPFYNKLIFLGQGSPNIFHNVTLWTVKPLALLTMLSTVSALQRQQWYFAVLAVVFAVLSLFAKPSFMLVFLPSLVVLVMAKKYFTRDNLIFVSVLTLTAVIILLNQYLHEFDASSKMIFDFLGVWSLSSRNIAISILLALAFPLLFTILYSEALKNDYLILAWSQTFAGILLYMCFAEEGPHYRHGNFGWSYMIAMSLLYVFAIIEFVKSFTSFHLWKRALLSTLLLVQTMTGLYYLEKILEGQNPMYIGLFI